MVLFKSIERSTIICTIFKKLLWFERTFKELLKECYDNIYIYVICYSNIIHSASLDRALDYAYPGQVGSALGQPSSTRLAGNCWAGPVSVSLISINICRGIYGVHATCEMWVSNVQYAGIVAFWRGNFMLISAAFLSIRCAADDGLIN